MHNLFCYKLIPFLTLNRTIFASLQTVAEMQRNTECEILKECRSLLHDERNIADACLANTQVPANNVSNHFEGGNRAGKKSETLGREKKGRVSLMGKALDFAA